MKQFSTLFKRDLVRTLNIRTLLIWLSMAGLGVFFFYATGEKTMLITKQQVPYMALFLPHMILGSWAVLSTFYDIISADREHNVLDCILCSGVSKKVNYLSKIAVIAMTSLLLSIVYLLPVTVVIISVGQQFGYIPVVLKYVIPFWGFIMVYAGMGVLISVIARSSKGALIISLAGGLVLMPRFFVMIVEGVGKAFHLSDKVVKIISLLAPGVMMQALSEASDISRFLKGMTIFDCSILVFLTIGYLMFLRQDEFNYGE